MNNKGFSLVELIVTFVIVGIIMGMAFPAVGRLQRQNQKQLYETYETAMEKAAKLYVDQYEVDLWNDSSNCVKIKYSTLKCEGLIKEYKSNKSEVVSNDDSYVVVRGSKNHTYEPYLVLKSGENEVYKTKGTAPSCNRANPNEVNCIP